VDIARRRAAPGRTLHGAAAGGCVASRSRRAGLLARARGACCFCAVWRGAAVSGRWRCVLAALSRFRGPSARSRWDRSTDGASPVSLGLAKDAYGAMLAITVEEEDGSSSCAREKKPRINYAPQHTHNLRRYIISTRHIELTACVELYITRFNIEPEIVSRRCRTLGSAAVPLSLIGVL
jgi:hypothetical protein